jgi:hypothetical protein
MRRNNDPEFRDLNLQFRAEALAAFRVSAADVLLPLVQDIAAQVAAATSLREAQRLSLALQYLLPSRVLAAEHKEHIALRAQYKLNRGASLGYDAVRKQRTEEEFMTLLKLQRDRFRVLCDHLPDWLARLRQVIAWRTPPPRAFRDEARRLADILAPDA